MNSVISRHIFMLCCFVLLSAVVMLSVNRFIYGFPGIFYMDKGVLGTALLTTLLRPGLKLLFPSFYKTCYWDILCEVQYLSSIISVIMISTTAVQYTPFAPIDKSILLIEQFLHLDVKSTVVWMNQSELRLFIGTVTYYSLGLQLMYLPVLLIFLNQRDRLREFYFLLLISWIIGISVYYFFPTIAPASNIDSPYFLQEQHATGLKFWQIHHYIQPITVDGGLIAFPSFHVIWAWLCVNLLRPWKVAFTFLLMVNATLAFSCVSLGWHYYLDVLCSGLILLLTHAIYFGLYRYKRAPVAIRGSDISAVLA